MINETLYNRTVDILVQAYFNDTLEQGNCYACAVGNIVAANLGYELNPLTPNDELFTYAKWKWIKNGRIIKYPSYENDKPSGWGAATCNANHYTGEAKRQIKATGYSLGDIMRIENAFERSYAGGGDEMFNGLMAVINALDCIHQNTDEEITLKSKQRFCKA